MNKIAVKLGIIFMLTGAILTAAILRPSVAMGQFFYMENGDIGKEIKDFTLNVVNGEKTNLKEYRNGKKSIVFFWATWCPHCVKELQVLNTQKEEIAKKNIRLVLVDVGENESTVDRYLKKKNIEMNVFLDDDSAVSDAYGLIGVPTFYIVDEKGIVVDVTHSLPKDLETVFSKT
jgi:peroxiredoxin